MKRCPSCNRTYTDATLSFCLDDGTPLQPSAGAPPSNFDPQATVSFQPGRSTNAPQQQIYGGQPTMVSSQTPVAQQHSWNQIPPQPPPARRSAWPWIIGIGAVVVLFVGGAIALIGLLAYIGSQASTANANTRSRNSGVVIKSNSNVSENANANASSTPDTTSPPEDLDDDFSTQKWSTGTDALGSFWYQDDEFHARAVPGRYVVEYAPKETPYYTKDASIKVTVRSIDGKSPRYGYGIVVHGELKNKQLEDYGFLIRTDDNPAFATVLHKDGKETYIHGWTSSPVIYTGTNSNQIEVRTKDQTMSFYVNGQLLDSIEDTAGFKTGRVGVYTSDTNDIAFDDLQITH
jgi:hypothetical protein